MKKILLLLSMTVMLFSMIEQANACDTGYTPITINMNVNGCVYKVDLCVKCSPLGQLSESISVVGFMKIPTLPNCEQNWTATQVLQYIELTVSNPDFYYSYICPDTYGAPPCPNQSNEIEIRHYNCWKVQLISYFGDETFYYSICDVDDYCYEVITWCYDPTIPVYNRTVSIGPTQVGEPDCTVEASKVTLPTELWEYSDCFIYPTACD